MAAVLMCAGAKGKRAALKHARIMIHQPMGGAEGQASDIEIAANEILFLKKRLNEILALHPGRDIAQIEKDTDRDNYLAAHQAVEYGLIDKVVEKRDSV